LATGLAMIKPDEVPQELTKAVKTSVWKAWLTLAASGLIVAGAGLLLTGFFLLIEPHVGSAAAFTTIGLITIALGGGLFLHKRSR